jgi:hypothetical protein
MKRLAQMFSLCSIEAGASAFSSGTHGLQKYGLVNKRGADSHVPSRKMPDHDKTSVEEKLEQGLEESMAGSDPVSITQPTASGRDTESDKR